MLIFSALEIKLAAEKNGFFKWSADPDHLSTDAPQIKDQLIR